MTLNFLLTVISSKVNPIIECKQNIACFHNCHKDIYNERPVEMADMAEITKMFWKRNFYDLLSSALQLHADKIIKRKKTFLSPSHVIHLNNIALTVCVSV